MAVRIEGVDKLIKQIGKVDDMNKLRNAMEKACADVEGDAKENAPKDTGNLRNQMQYKVEVRGTDIVGTVFNPEEYAIYVHEGTGLSDNGYWVYVKDGGGGGGRTTGKRYTKERAKQIVAIMRSEGLDAYYTNGMQPRPFLTDALHQNRGKIINRIEEAIK